MVHRVHGDVSVDLLGLLQDGDEAALDAFLKSREARSTLQEMVRGIPEDSPTLQPLRNAARTFNGRLLSLSGMPERPIEVVEQEAIEAAQQLQSADSPC